MKKIREIYKNGKSPKLRIRRICRIVCWNFFFYEIRHPTKPSYIFVALFWRRFPLVLMLMIGSFSMFQLFAHTGGPPITDKLRILWYLCIRLCVVDLLMRSVMHKNEKKFVSKNIYNCFPPCTQTTICDVLHVFSSFIMNYDHHVLDGLGT